MSRRGLATVPPKQNYLLARAKTFGAIGAGGLAVAVLGYGVYRTTQFMSSLTFVNVSSFGFYVGGVVSAALMAGAFLLARCAAVSSGDLLSTLQLFWYCWKKNDCLFLSTASIGWTITSHVFQLVWC